MVMRLRGPDWPYPTPDKEGVFPQSAYFEAIGRLVTRWNTAEVQFQALVRQVSGLPEDRAAALLTHVHSGTLVAAFITLANTVFKEGPYLEECIFIRKLFETNRENRNFIVHTSGPVNEELFEGNISKTLILGQEFSRFTARGKLLYYHFYVSYPDLRAVCEEMWDMLMYFRALGETIAPQRTLENPTFPARPPLPRKLESHLPTTELGDGIPYPSTWSLSRNT